MKASYKFLFILSFLFLLSSCAADDVEDIGQYLKAAVHNPCNLEINYDGDDRYIYYGLDDLILRRAQLGGHPSHSSELPDLGINIWPHDQSVVFGDDELSGGYEITNRGGEGKALVYYIDENDIQYVSSENQGTVDVSSTITNDKLLLVVTFDNVEVVNIENPQDKLCINKFEFFDNDAGSTVEFQ